MQKIFIDVREPHEFARGHVDGALNVPPADLLAGAEKLKDVPKNTQLIVYCISGVRSRAAIEILRQYGFTDLINGINQGHIQKNLADSC